MVEPEDLARHKIDKMLADTGWIVQDYKELNLGAGLGVAVREFPLGKDSADYVLFIDRNPVGVIEAKRVGWTLSGVTEQSEGYIKSTSQPTPAQQNPPFANLSFSFLRKASEHFCINYVLNLIWQIIIFPQ